MQDFQIEFPASATMVLGFNFNCSVVSSYHLAPFRAADKMEDVRMALACLVSPDIPLFLPPQLLAWCSIFAYIHTRERIGAEEVWKRDGDLRY